MPFLARTRQEIASRQPTDPVRITLEFLLNNAVGRNSAIPIGDVLDHLATHGIQMRYNEFQQSILGVSRHGNGSFFIGSGTTGIYLLRDIEDARAMKEFYEAKMLTQQQNLGRLLAAASNVGWRL